MMKKRTFLTYERPLLTSMVQADNPDRIKELIDASITDGAEAIGMQFCQLKPEYRNEDTYKDLFTYCDLPVYVTNYRGHTNEGKSDDTLAAELIGYAKCGATLCDVMGDIFDASEDELTMNGAAVEKQMKLINDLHGAGAEVLMSSHVRKFIPAERVLEIALEHQRRGADIRKIVTGAQTLAEQIENMRIANLLKGTLKIPFLYLSVGQSHILRRIGGVLGSCMYLGVHEHDEFATKSQPLVRDIKVIRDLI